MKDFFYKNNTKISIILFITFLIGGISKCIYDKRKLDNNKKILYCTVKKKSEYRKSYTIFFQNEDTALTTGFIYKIDNTNKYYYIGI